MHKILTISILLVLSIAEGCGNKGILKNPKKKNILLTVDFRQGKTLQYKFTSERNVTVDWNPSESAAGENEPVLIKSMEKLDLIMAYTPIEINPYGLTTIKATCQAAKVGRNEGTQKDPAEYFMDKSFTFTIDPTGKIHDNSQLENLIKQVGEKAFIHESGQGTIKQPDMIGDFIATQWFLWDSISSIPNASQGLSIGQSWTSKLPVPTPMVSRLARDVIYTLDEIHRNENGNIALINNSYDKADSVPQSWPVPYTGSFQMRGTFGLLGSYKLLDLAGQGRELFNIDSGQIEENNQHYEVNIQASVPLGLDVKPVINIKQTISMKLVEE